MTPLRSLFAAHTPDRRNLLGGAATGAVAMAVNKLSMLLVAVLFARLLGVERYGIYAFCIALGALLGLLAEFGMGQLILRRVAHAEAIGNPQRIARLSRSAIAVLLRNWTAIAAVGLLAIWTTDLVANRETRLALSVMLGWVLASGLQRLVFSQLYGLRRLQAAQFAESLVAPLFLVLAATVVWLWMPGIASPEGAIGLHLAGAALAFLFGWLAVSHGKAGSGARARTVAPRKMLGFGTPFMLIGAASALNTQVDTVVVGMMLGLSDTGIYRVGAQIAIISISLTAVIGSICSPYFARYHKQGDLDRLRRLYRVATLVGLASLAGFFVFLLFAGDLFIELTFGLAFAGAYPVMTILTLGYLVNFVFGPAGTLLSMTGHERQVSSSLWATGIANLLGSVIAAQYFGIIGVAMVTSATIVGYHAVLRLQVRRLLGF